MKHESDEAIYRRYRQQRDERDLESLLLRHREGLTLFANTVLHDLDDAEEIMLDTFAVAASRTTRFDGRSSFKTWLYSIARKLAVTRLRKKRLRIVSLDDSFAKRPDVDALEGEFQLLQSERKRELYQSLAQLHPNYQQVLYLLYVEQISAKEVARIMHRTTKQIYNLTQRGRDALREELAKGAAIDA